MRPFAAVITALNVEMSLLRVVAVFWYFFPFCGNQLTSIYMNNNYEYQHSSLIGIAIIQGYKTSKNNRFIL